MLRELIIKDFAIIERLSVSFGPGLNVLTGETGAGKSIVVDALGLAIGERAQSEFVRTGRPETVVEAFFDVDMPSMLEPLGISSESGVILRRNASAAGKSKAYINDTMVNVQTLLDVGRSLVDIHGQHEHQSLLSSAQQLELLDGYGRLLRDRERFGQEYREFLAAKAEAIELRKTVREREQKIDFLRFQIQEIDAAAPAPGEEEALGEERAILANLSKLKGITDSAYATLYSDDGAVAEKVASVLSMVKEISRIDQSVSEMLTSLDSAKALIDEAANSLRSFRNRYDLDPNRLDAVEQRLDLLRRLEKKYGEGTEAIIAYRQRASDELNALTLSDERLGEIEKIIRSREAELLEEAERLSAKREKAAADIESTVRPILRDLAMGKARLAIGLRHGELSANGVDVVEFLFSANDGEPLKPLAKIASGGELSRVMLALKEVLAEADRVPVLIFDEVDAGIGGRTAEQVGKRLKSLSKRHQVLCITHLPQIAATADHHLVIEKTQGKAGVCVRVRNVLQQDREEEIARMLSGNITDISIRHARELLGSADER